jgi:hypothetical protein
VGASGLDCEARQKAGRSRLNLTQRETFPQNRGVSDRSNARLDNDGLPKSFEVLYKQGVTGSSTTLGLSLTIRETRQPTRNKYAVPAKLAHCEAPVSAVLLSKKNSLSRRTRADIDRLVQITHPVTLAAGRLRSDALTYLLWEASWRGVSTPQQTAEPPLHVQRLTAKWWIGLPEETRYGSPTDLLSSLASSVASLLRCWQGVLERMRPFGFYFFDPRLVRIEWRPPIRSAAPKRQPLVVLPYAPRQKSDEEVRWEKEASNHEQNRCPGRCAAGRVTSAMHVE